MINSYDTYLREHKENVIKAYEWLKVNIESVGSVVRFNPERINEQIANHDVESTEEFNVAWLKHIHRNSHHWQHWVLINDDEENGIVALKMPWIDILEMICDWWSFSWRSGNLYEIFDFYEAKKGYMMLHKETREELEGILRQMKEKLDGYKGSENTKNPEVKYRRKPIVVEALEWTGENHRDIWNFLTGRVDDYMEASGDNFYIDHSKVAGGLVIKTIEDGYEEEYLANIGDYIIKGVRGEFYPCKPGIFKETYEEVKE